MNNKTQTYLETIISKLKNKLKRDGFEELQFDIFLRFWRPNRFGQVKSLDFLRSRFEKTYPVTKKRIASPGRKGAFDSCEAIIDGIVVQYHSEYYDNPDFNRDLCIEECATDREKARILEKHKHEMDVKGRVKRIKEKEEIGCYE